MGVMERRRQLLRNPPLLPIAYQRVKWLGRTIDNNGPYSQIAVIVGQGDTIITRTSLIDATGERAFAGTYSVSGYPNVELYYNTNNNPSLRAYSNTSGVISSQSRVSGEPDELTVIIGKDNVLINYLGCYRTATYKFGGRIYGLTIKNASGDITHDFVPCYRKLDNEPGFVDRITRAFYPNVATTGTWEIGDIVRE